MRRSRAARAARHAPSSVSFDALGRASGQLDLRVLRLEPLRPVDRRVEVPLVRRVDVPVLRDVPLLFEELVLRVELLRRALPVAVFAALCAALAACSKSLRSALLNFVESRRASETNLPRPLYRVLVPAAASFPVCFLRSVSARWAWVSDWLSRLSAAGSLKLAPLRDEDRVDFRAWGTRSPQTRKRICAH